MLSEVVDLKDSINDTPFFRFKLNQFDSDLNQLDLYLKNLSKLFKETNELASGYGKKMVQLCDVFDNGPNLLTKINVDILNPQSNNESNIFNKTLKNLCDGLREIERSRSMLTCHINDMFILPLDQLIKSEIPLLKDGKRKFDKSSDDYESQLNKYMAKKPNDPSINDSYLEVTRSKDEFRQVAFDHAFKVNKFQGQIKVEMVENALAMAYTTYTFHHQGYETFKELDPFMKDITAELSQVQSKQKKDLIEVESLRKLILHSEYGTSDGDFELLDTDLFTSRQAGYLYLKNDGYFPNWLRYYFKIDDDFLFYYSKDNPDVPLGQIDLKLCAVKYPPNLDRRFSFWLYSNDRTYQLQADNEPKLKMWVNTLQSGIETALKFHNHTNGRPGVPSRTVSTEFLELNLAEKIRNLPGNETCADCQGNSPVWACINLGIVLCIECSGLHRSLGSHLSKVRSLTLDKWDEELVQVMLELGNLKVNQLIAPNQKSPIHPNSSKIDKLEWIKAKYVDKKFFIHPNIYQQNDMIKKDEEEENDDDNKNEEENKNEEDEDIKNEKEHDEIELKNQSIIEGSSMYLNLESSILNSNIISILFHLFSHPNPESIIIKPNNFTLNHLAVKAQKLHVIEFLLLWQIELDQKDIFGKTILHLAAKLDNPKLVWYLLKKGADYQCKDNDDKLPLDLATNLANVQVVMAFRYFIFLKQANPQDPNPQNLTFDQANQVFGTI